MTPKATDPIMEQISGCKKQMSAESNSDAKKAARKHNVSVESLIWLIMDVYDSGHVRSAAYKDCPACVIEYGLVVQSLGLGLNYTPWMLTDKALGIMAIVKQDKQSP